MKNIVIIIFSIIFAYTLMSLFSQYNNQRIHGNCTIYSMPGFKFVCHYFLHASYTNLSSGSYGSNIFIIDPIANQDHLEYELNHLCM